MPNQPLPGVTVLTFPRAGRQRLPGRSRRADPDRHRYPGRSRQDPLGGSRDAGHSEGELKRILLTHRHSESCGQRGGARPGPPEHRFSVHRWTHRTSERESSSHFRARQPHWAGSWCPTSRRLCPGASPRSPPRTVSWGEATVGPFRVIDTPGPYRRPCLAAVDRSRNPVHTATPQRTSRRSVRIPPPTIRRPARRSFQALGHLDFDAACFGHGRPLLGAATQFRARG